MEVRGEDELQTLERLEKLARLMVGLRGTFVSLVLIVAASCHLEFLGLRR